MTRRLILGCIWMLMAIGLFAQQGPDADPSIQQGYVNNVFHASDVDSVNLFNGQLTIPIALGPKYQIGPKLTYQALITYGSKVWEYGRFVPSDARITYTPISGNSALGIGWTFTLGAIKTSCANGPCYYGPDGSEHHFNQVQPNGYLKTSDGSQLYLFTRSGNTGYDMWDGDGNHYDFSWQVSGFDDAFNPFIHDFGHGRDGFYLSTLTDPFNNQMTVQYVTGVAPCWTSHPTTCTATKMVCPAQSQPLWIPSLIAIKPAGVQSATINVNVDGGNKITGIVFNQLPVGTNGAAEPVTYSFQYQTQSFSNQCDNIPTVLATDLEEIKEIDLASTPVSGSLGSYVFGYTGGVLTAATLPTLAEIDYTYGTWSSYHGKAAQLGSGCGPIKPITNLPVVRSPDFPFGPVAMNPESDVPVPSLPVNCDPMNPDPLQYVTYQSGVTQRVEKVPGSNPATTTYTHYAYPYGETASSPPPTGPNSQDLTVVVFPSNVDGAVHAKAVLFQAGPHGGTTSPLPGDRTGADLQERIFDHDPNPTGTPGEPVCGSSSLCASNAARVTDRTFDYDDPAVQLSNRRLLTETTCYGSESNAGACSTSTKHKVAFTLDSSCGGACAWEGNGRHYNVETHTDGSGATIRTISTVWTPNNWTSNPFSGTPLPNLMSERKKFDSTLTVDQYFDYTVPSGPITGFLRGTATFDGVHQYSVFNCRYPDSAGNVDAEFSASSPIGAIPPGFCVTIYPTIPTNVLGVNNDAFGKDHVYQHSLRTTTNWLYSSGGSNHSIGWYAFHADRDGPSGWITKSYDTAAVSTAYGFDALGRVTSIAPSGEAATYVCYDSTTQTTAYRNASQLTCPVAGSSTTLIWERYIYDGLGRLTREFRKTGTGAFAFRTHKFDGEKNAYFDSEWGSCTSDSGDCLTNPDPPATNKSAFDPLGRPQKIVGPSNATYTAIDRTDGSILYSDTFETVTSCVDGTWSGSACVDIADLSPQLHISPKTTNRKDLFGRVTTVAEDTTGLNYSTTYTYDVNDKLTSVTQTGQTARAFTYDPFGFLRTEFTPEKGTVSMTTTGTPSYPLYGSLGNLKQKTEGGSSITSFLYDPAGRVSCALSGAVSGTMPTCANPGTGTTMYVQNLYDGAGFSGGNSPLGKLTRQIGSNPSFMPFYPANAVDEDVQEDFTYSGVGGRLSQKNTVTSTGALGPVHGVDETWQYNNLGLMSQHGHPRAQTAVNTGTGAQPGSFVENITYTYGRPTSVTLSGVDYTGAATTGGSVSATFQPAGNIATYTVSQTGGQSMTTTITQDASGLPRPGHITSSLGGFDTGSYTYDAAGNVAEMKKDSSNKDVFTYDALDRISKATYTVAGSPSSQSFSYDRYANLLSVTGTNPRTLCTGSCTNNKLPSPASYDTRGNLLSYSPDTLTWDTLNRMTRDQGSGTDWQYLLGGKDERAIRVTGATSASNVTRREMSRFLTEAKVQAGQWSLTGTLCTEPALSGGHPFTDVDCADPDWTLIQTFYEQGITAGCGGNAYCPDVAVTRAQMSVFLLKSEHGSTYVPPSCTTTHVFDDVVCPSQYSDWIGELYVEGITAGCGGNNFCPNNNATEFQMAGFLNKGPNSFGPGMWPNYHGIPGGAYYTVRGQDDHLVTEFADSFPSTDNVFLGNTLVASYVSKSPLVTTPAWHLHSSDHLGTVRLSVDGKTGGGVVESHKYWPYGDDTGGILPLQKLAFAAMERDVESNHFYDHARHHDFNLGRFVSPDIMKGSPRDPESWNRYSYARDNPLILVDPNGLAVYVVNTFFPNPDPEHGLNPKIDQSIAKNLAAAGATYLRYGEYTQEMLADIVGNPSNDVVFFGHSVLLGQDFLLDPVMLGRNEGQLINSGLAGLVSARSFSVIGCSTTSLCGAAALQSTPGARTGGLAAGDPQDPGTNRLGVFADRLASLLAAGIPLEGAIKAAEKAANTDPRIKPGQAPVVVMKVCANGTAAPAAAPCSGP